MQSCLPESIFKTISRYQAPYFEKIIWGRLIDRGRVN
jgi:hypothetical protein